MLGRWWRVFAGLALYACLGSLYNLGRFSDALQQEFGWSEREVSLTLPIALCCFAVTAVIAGAIQDRCGPGPNAHAGGLLLSLGFLAASWTSSLTELYLTLGVIVGVANGFGYSAGIPVAAKWFPDRRGLAIGIVVAGYPCATLIGIIIGDLVESVGWRNALRIPGAAFLVVTAAAAALLRNPPGRAEPVAGIGPRQLLRSTAFYRVWFAYFLATTAGIVVASQWLSHVRQVAAPVSPMAWAVPVAAACNGAGRIACGWLSDRFGRLTLLVGVVSLMTAACLALLLGSGLVGIVSAALCVYWSYGAMLALIPSLAADHFGVKHLGVNYGALLSAWALAAIIGPWIGGRLYLGAERGSAAFLGASILAAAALGVVVWLRATDATRRGSGDRSGTWH